MTGFHKHQYANVSKGSDTCHAAVASCRFAHGRCSKNNLQPAKQCTAHVLYASSL